MRNTLTLGNFRHLMAMLFATLFFIFAVCLTGMTLHELWEGTFGSENLIGSFLKAINTAVIALATFELGLVVSKEYGAKEDDHIVVVLRRTVPRFVSIVCVALVLEGLLLVIKYSQLDLAGNLYYPVAIIAAASLLLMSLGVFLRFSSVAMETASNALPDPGAHASCVPPHSTYRSELASSA